MFTHVGGQCEDLKVSPCIRTYYAEEDLLSYFELDEEEWALRQVDLRGPDRRPVTAATMAEVLHLRDHADLAAMQAYERRFGVLAEASLIGWETVPGAAEVPAQEFERIWALARAAIEERT
jgi:hypothetical protein